jgi:transcriptional regulator with XRE-family HTH domain
MGRNILRSPRGQKERQLFLSLLRQTRKEAHLRQADVAQALGTTQAFVSKYELGERRLDILDLARVCDVLGISLLEFVRRFDDKRRRL